MSAAHLDSQTAHLLPMSPTGGLPISRSSVRASQMLYGAPPHANTMTVFPGGPAGTVACSQVGGGLLPQQQHRLYSTIPAVSDALRERASSGTTATLMTRQVFQPTIGRPVKLMGTCAPYLSFVGAFFVKAFCAQESLFSWSKLYLLIFMTGNLVSGRLATNLFTYEYLFWVGYSKATLSFV